MAKPTSETAFLDNPTIQDKWQALRLNVEAWYQRYALAQHEEQILRMADVLLTPEHATIPNEASLRDGSQIDQILDWYRNNSDPRSTIIWYLHPSSPSSELNAKLLARGVSTNWEPHWMWCSLAERIQPSQPNSLVDIRITGPADVQKALKEESSVTSRDAEAVTRLVWHITAFRDESQLGRCDVNLTTGTYGVGGLFDMEVDSEHRRRGIGAALLAAGLDLVQSMGCNHMYLNSTPDAESLYQRQGFRSLSRGATWHLRDNFNRTAAPSRRLVAFLEALGQGRIADLDKLSEGLTVEEMQGPTINTMTPLQITVHLSQPQSASWLIDHGVIPDVISLWDLGLKDKAAQLLVARPTEVNRKGGDHKATPLHTAVSRDDVELAQMLLAVPEIDLDIKDDMFKATPLNWAEFLQKANILALLKEKLKGGSEKI